MTVDVSDVDVNAREVSLRAFVTYIEGVLKRYRLIQYFIKRLVVEITNFHFIVLKKKN